MNIEKKNSNEQIRASTACGAKSLSQYSQFGLSSRAMISAHNPWAVGPDSVAVLVFDGKGELS